MKLLLDQKYYNEKPKDPWNITKRIIKHPLDIEPADLAREVTKGRTFVPSLINTKVNGELARNIDCWTSQQLICLDFDSGMRLEDALNEFRNDAMFVYTTFTHTEKLHKFRVVFALEHEVIDYNFIQYIYKYFESKYTIDKQCKDGSRMFYGGRKLYELDYNNRLNNDVFYSDYLKTHIYQGEIECRNNNNQSKHITIVPTFGDETQSLDTTKISSHSDDYNNVKLIRNKDVQRLRGILKVNSDRQTFYTLHELKDYLFSQDLYKFLGVSGSKFRCCFHYDTDPSAGILYDTIQKRYIYKCFSDNCGFGSGLIIKGVENILECDYMDAINFLMDVYNVEYKETEWQKIRKQKLDYSKQYIVSDEFQVEYPELYKRIKNYIPELDALIDIARMNMPAEHYDNEQIENLFFASIRHFANRMGKGSLGQITNEIALFVYLGLMSKLKKDDVPKHLLDRAEEELKKNKNKFKNDDVPMISFFSISDFTSKVLGTGESRAIQFKEKKFTMRGWSYEMLLRGLGEEEANRVYPQMAGKKISQRSHRSANLIENVVLRMIDNQGWVTEDYVVNAVVKNYKSGKEYTKTQIKKIMAEMIDKYDLDKMRLTKELKGKLGIDEEKVKGSPSVLIKK